MTEILKTYHETCVVPCTRCQSNPTLAPWVTLEKPIPYQGRSESSVLILGHSPSVRTRKDIQTVLDLDRHDVLCRYLIHEVLEPLGLSLEQCAATNVVKCFTRRMPEDLAAEGIDLMELAFTECSWHLEREVQLLQPRLVISLSQRVLQLLSKRYLNLMLEMKAMFGSLLYLPVEGMEIPWIPIVHLPKAKVRKYYFPAQTERLRALNASANNLLQRGHLLE